MPLLAYQCATGEALPITLAVTATTAIAPPDDSVDTNTVVISGNGTISSFGSGPVGVPITKTVWLSPVGGSITLVNGATLVLLGGANRVASVALIGKYYWDGVSKWTELTSQDVTVTGFLPLSGGTLSGPLTVNADIYANFGISMGSAVAPLGATDVSRHLDLYGGTYGINVTSSNLNLVSGGVAGVNLAGGNMTVNGTLTSTSTLQCSSGVIYTKMPNLSSNAHVGFLNTSGTVVGWLYWDYANSNMVLVRAGGQSITLSASSVTMSGPTSVTGSFSSTQGINSNSIYSSGNLQCVTTLTVGGSSSQQAIACTSITDSGNFLGTSTYPIYYAPGGTDFYFTSDANYKYLFEQGGAWYHLFARATGSRQWLNNTVWGMICDPSGNFTINGGGYKPGGGSWAASSDARIKDVVGEYDKGLDEVLQLRPVVYTYKGNHTLTEEPDVPPGPTPPPIPEQTITDENGVERKIERPADDGVRIAPLKWKNGDRWRKGDGAPYPNSMTAMAALNKTQYVGMVAQEVETIFPGMVKKTKGWIDGVEVDDLRELDTTPLIYALVNAVKTLNARVAELEAARA